MKRAAGHGSFRQAQRARAVGATFLIEFDDSGGNHIHAVWRDFEDDFSRDVLGDDYRGAADTAHGRGSR